MTGLQRNTSEVLYHSLSDRDLQIAHWKQENEALKKSYALTTGAGSLVLPLFPPPGNSEAPSGPPEEALEQPVNRRETFLHRMDVAAYLRDMTGHRGQA